jgi:hypothetical protein
MRVVPGRFQCLKETDTVEWNAIGAAVAFFGGIQ